MGGLGVAKDYALGLLLVAAGVGLIAFVARMELRDRAEQPWGDAVFVPEGEALWEGVLLVASRRVPLDNFPQEKAMVDLFRPFASQDIVALFSLDKTEWVVSIDAPVEIFEPLLASGRLPEPGTPEVLAGEFARLDEFTMDDTRFKAVGRLQRGVSGFAFTYLLPEHAGISGYFTEEKGATKGWCDPQGLHRLEEMVKGGEPFDGLSAFVALVPTERRYSWGVILGLVLVATGGAMVQLRFFGRLAPRRCGPFSPAFRAIAGGWLPLAAMHILLFGSFFAMMAVGMERPIDNMRLQNYVLHAFTEGELGYIGNAYASGNIPLAAAATFVNNFALQVVVLTILISFVIPAIGVLKNVLSFMMAGFVMSPIWAGLAMTLVYHSITMTLELEAYVVASFVVCLFWWRIARGLAKGGFLREAKEGLKEVASGTLLAGVMLAAAALYEAATLILLA